MKCKKCERDINEKHLTKNGCIYCDAEYHRKKMRKKKV